MVERGYEEPQDNIILTMSQRDSLKDIRKKDKKRLFLIYQELDKGNFEKVTTINISKDVWEIL